jgi:hypothetical protein
MAATGKLPSTTAFSSPWLMERNTISSSGEKRD